MGIVRHLGVSQIREFDVLMVAMKIRHVDIRISAVCSANPGIMLVASSVHATI